VLSISGFAQDNFTGEVKMRMSESEGRAFDISYLVKDNLIRFGTDMEGQKMGIIFNSEKNVMLMIMDEQKMYMEMPMDMINKQMDKKGNNTDSENKFTATGETKEIIGYASEKWLYEDEKNKAEVWLTKDIGKFKFFEGGLGGMQKTEGWQSSIEKSGSFPVLVINRDKSGNELNRLEVLSVEKKELDDILFTVPSGYKKFDMPKMN
jgi:hypothetical protein